MIVFVSESEEADRTFRQMAGRSARAIVSVRDIDSAREQIRKTHPQLVVCDTVVQGGQTWRDLLEKREAAEYELLVVSRHANETLWAEVLHLGGFDVLVLPFEREELEWVLASALMSHRPYWHVCP